MTHKFKIGDRVVCVNNYGAGELILGKIYTIAGFSDSFCLLTERHSDFRYLEHRFELAEQQEESRYITLLSFAPESYTTYEKALEEAKKSAKAAPGSLYTVLKVAANAVVEINPKVEEFK